MPTFSPPTVSDLDAVPAVRPNEMTREEWSVAKRLFSHYGGNPRGLSVVFVNGHYTIVDNPYSDVLVGPEGVLWFLGGHTYTVSAAVASALNADGFVTV